MIISTIGRKHIKTRLLLGGIATLLLLGATTMIYPFLLMISGSMKSGVDIKDFDAIPAFLTDDDMLYRKYTEGLFNESLNEMRVCYNSDLSSFEKVEPPTDINEKLVQSWRDFLAEDHIPHTALNIGFLHTPTSLTEPELLRALKKEMIEAFDGDITRMNREMETEYYNWNAFYLLPDVFLERRSHEPAQAFYQRYKAFKLKQTDVFRYVSMVEGFYKVRFVKNQYTRDIANYNESHGSSYSSYDHIRLPYTQPGSGTAAEQEDWERFVRESLNLLWIRLHPDAQTDYQRFLAAKYQSIEKLNKNHGAQAKRFEDIPLPDRLPSRGSALSDWDAFIKGWKDPISGQLYIAAADHLEIHSPERLFRNYLESKHASIEAANTFYETHFTSWLDIFPPQAANHYLHFQDHRSPLKKEFASRNYVAVIDYIVLHGRGVLNTVIYCALSVLLALIVNPMAAYALSRYRMPNTYQLLLFMLMTMAFPPMVTQIPVFLMLRDFNMLNTFWALILPGMAHGYSIFLLKGFFDSLPRELFESAQIDGANEWTMFWRITMSLSKPILAVIALHAFTTAYTNFMFALLICQDENMWTLMVWLYQLQQTKGPAVVYASLIIAALPTFVIFVFCQNIIMRGIVVPVEK